ncbi:hypothetical protein KTS45_18775 [Halomicroarcula limicola]|uniref:DUF7344 domain-containing protein n=1 Tax=Haloarcula limicola TaxID=1429915 RepID=A0A8J7Y7Z8_9EURY|nr:hypothetical protein [Halomicroarcula limicola]MBV0926255.1 hypothetical protein [Halomicroarcula limicola]
MSQSTPQGTSAYPALEQLSNSEYYEILSSDRRRTTLKVLTEQTTPVELEALAAAVATRENDTDTATEERIKQVAVTLHHLHLPKMDDFGVVEYDANTNRVESCP